MPKPKKAQSLSQAQRLPRILTPLETWGFGMSGHIVWIISGPAVFHSLGLASMYTWLPLSLTAMLSCFQIRRLALRYPDVSGGVPSYIYRLFPKWKLFSTYVALGWFIGWVMAFTVYGIIIVEAIEAVFLATGVSVAYFPLVFLFSIIGFVVGFSSLRALSILHLLFVIPTMILLLLFSGYGLFWLAFSPNSPGFFPETWPKFEFSGWVLATFLATYNIITMETEAVFSADSLNPRQTLRFLPFSAFLVVPIFLGGSYVLARLGSLDTDGSTFAILNSANVRLFGANGTVVTLVTVVLSCLLSSASGVAIAPRVLYQLSKDRLLDKIFGYLSQSGVAVYSLWLCVGFTLVSLFLGGVEVIFFSAGLSYLLTYTVLNFGLWVNRKGISKDIFPKVSLIVSGFYLFLIAVGGWLAGWDLMVGGLLMPLIPMLISWVLTVTKPSPWRLPIPRFLSHQNFVLNQIVVSILVVALSVGGVVGAIALVTGFNGEKLLYIGILGFLILSFCSVGIAAWTTIPQLSVIETAKQKLATANTQLETDIKIQNRLEKKLQKNLRTDQLTGLGNRLLLEEELATLLAAEQNLPHALIFADLDRFKLVNDSLGHALGDRLLRLVAKRFQEIIQEQGLVIRLGGDEFVLLLPDTRDLHLENLAKTIVRRFQEPFVVDKVEFITTASIGVVEGNKRYQNAADIVRDADVAMYQSKSNGRNRYTFFSEEMYQRAVLVQATEDMLRRAIRHRWVRVFYQPIVDLRTKKIVGMEALVRIAYRQTLLSPGEFIEEAEESGLIVPLTEVILDIVCAQQKIWYQKGRRFYVAVNIADRSLQQVGFAREIKRKLRTYTLPANALHIEILESSIMTDTAVVKQNLEELSAFGIQIAVDDFGTGYSNLSRLRELPITTLKIDRSFVVNMHERGFEIIQTIAQLAEVLGLRTLVEGIETESELSLILDTSCGFAQGYFFQKPLSADELERTLSPSFRF